MVFASSPPLSTPPPPLLSHIGRSANKLRPILDCSLEYGGSREVLVGVSWIMFQDYISENSQININKKLHGGEGSFSWGQFSLGRVHLGGKSPNTIYKWYACDILKTLTTRFRLKFWNKSGAPYFCYHLKNYQSQSDASVEEILPKEWNFHKIIFT